MNGESLETTVQRRTREVEVANKAYTLLRREGRLIARSHHSQHKENTTKKLGKYSYRIIEEGDKEVIHADVTHSAATIH